MTASGAEAPGEVPGPLPIGSSSSARDHRFGIVWIEVGLLVFLTVFAVVGISVMRRSDPGPAAFWSWACVAILGSGLCTAVATEVAWALPAGYALGTAYPALILGGALAYGNRRVPWWLIPPALALGAARALLAQAGRLELAQGLALTVEPTLALVAAFVVWRATPRPGATAPQLALAPVLAGVAVLEAATAIATVPATALPGTLLGLWVLGAPLLLVLQVAAASDRSQDILLRARDELERRVDERTAELAASVGELEQQVAERRAAEEALRVSEERYRVVSELSSDYSYAFRVDANGDLHGEWATGALTRITGYAMADLDGDGWLSLVPPELRGGAQAQLAAIASGRWPGQDFPIRTKAGEERWLSMRLAMVTSEADGRVRVVGAVKDVTERRLADRERRRLDRHMAEVQRLESLGLLAGGIAHDFNNLLTVVLGNARLVLEDLDPSLPSRVRVERVQAAAQLAAGLTEQILTYAGQGPVELEPLDLSQLTGEMLDLLRATLSPKDTLEPDLTGGVPAVEGDPNRLRQVLLNLVGNASAALGESGGMVRVRTGVLHAEPHDLEDTFGTPDPSDGEYVMLEVSDTGCGMDPDVQERIFEPFYTTRAAGRGLGLPVVLGIVRAHRGLIRLRSEPGVGTTLCVLLPASTRSAPEAGVEPLAPPVAQGVRVLVVDDDEAVVEVAREFLERAGFEVTAALGGEAALEALRAAPHEIDAVVLDLAMPGLGGEEALAELRRLRPGLPVVIASGFDRENLASRTNESEGLVFLAKPYAPEQLVTAVSKVLGRS